MPIAKYVDPARRTRRWITLGLVLGGAVAGATFGVVLTAFGKIVAGAPPADLATYVWNARIFAVMGACIAPAVTWSALRAVPLWRTIVEPLAGTVIGAGIGVLLGSPLGFLVLAPVGGAAAALRLALAHKHRVIPRGT